MFTLNTKLLIRLNQIFKEKRKWLTTKENALITSSIQCPSPVYVLCLDLLQFVRSRGYIFFYKKATWDIWNISPKVDFLFIKSCVDEQLYFIHIIFFTLMQNNLYFKNQLSENFMGWPEATLDKTIHEHL